MEREIISSLFSPLMLKSGQDRQMKQRIGRHWFIETCRSQAREFAAHELVVRFWNQKETETDWFSKAITRIRVKSSQVIYYHLRNFDNLSQNFLDELNQAMIDAAEESLIEGTVPYKHCFRPAKVNDYLRWFDGYQDKNNCEFMPACLVEYIDLFSVAIYPFKIDPHREMYIITPAKVPILNPKTPLGATTIYLMDGYKLRGNEPYPFVFQDMERMVKATL
jgi:hypothetical protein